MSPTERMRQEIPKMLRSGMHEDARLAAMIILAEPERIGQEPIADFLRRIKCIEHETVCGWLNAAHVNPLRRGCDLSEVQRRAIARELTAFWKTWKAGQS